MPDTPTSPEPTPPTPPTGDVPIRDEGSGAADAASAEASSTPPDGAGSPDRAAPPSPRRARSRRAPRAKPPGLREQVANVYGAGRRMVDAHVALAKAELEPILDNVKAAAAQAAAALGAALFAALLVTVGTPLFLGEWIFGSMGWGILHGLLMAAALIAACASLILVADVGSLGRRAFVAGLLGIVLSVVFGLSLTNQAWQAVTDQLNVGLPVEWRLLGVAAGVSAIVGAAVGAIVGAWRGGGRTLLDGLVFGTLLGLLVGVFTAISFGWQTGIAVGISAAFVTFVALVALRLTTSVDMEALKARYYPEQTIVTTKETLEWLQEQAPTGPKP
jgi:hypothetical protein